MVVLGEIIGAVMFYFQSCTAWDVTQVSVIALVLATLMNVLLIPATTGMEVRGVGEMYPLYMVHYPFIYLYYAWVKNENLTFLQSIPGAAALFFGCIVLAWLCLKLYDVPVRAILTKHLLKR